MHEHHPFVDFKPPVLEPLGYLCVIEHELTVNSKDRVAHLAVLNTLLQDQSLADLIGWDLVTILTPLLPAAEECMQTVFTLGNPREVALRVAVAFEQLFGPDDDDDDSNGDASEQDSQGEPSNPLHASHRKSPHPKAVQFSILMKLLPPLLKRLKARKPSLFMASLMQSIVYALELARQELDLADLQVMYDAYLFLLDAIPTNGKPSLPPRVVSPHAPREPSARPALDRTKDSPTEETEVHIRLVQASIVSTFYIYLVASTSSLSASGLDLGLAGRLKELHKPATILPKVIQHATTVGHAQAMNELFISDPGLVDQDETIKTLVALSYEHGITSEDLLHDAMTKPLKEPWDFESDEPPRDATNIPFSPAAATALLSARKAYRQLHASNFTPNEAIMDLTYISTNFVRTHLAGRPYSAQNEPSLQIFPHHAAITHILLTDINVMPSSGILDALLALGLDAVHESERIEAPEDDSVFRDYCRDIARVSACSDSPQLRYLAHLLVSTVLHSHSRESVRLAFIKQTLSDCPFDNLCETAVGWFKAETLAADGERDNASSFANGRALQEIAPILFPELNREWAGLSAEGKMSEIQEKLGTFLATLNFYHFLILARPKQQPLKFAALHLGSEGVEGTKHRFLLPLIETLNEVKREHFDQVPLEIEMVLALATTVIQVADEVQATGVWASMA